MKQFNDLMIGGVPENLDHRNRRRQSRFITAYPIKR